MLVVLEILFGIGIVSASLQVLLDRIVPRGNTFSNFWQRHESGMILFKDLETTMLQVNAVLSDAEEKQITNLFVRQWIDELKDVAYHTADLLDEIHSKALKEIHTTRKKSGFETVIRDSKPKLKEMTRKLDKLAKYKDVLGLKDSFSGKPSPRLQLTSLVDETEVYGRATDKKEIMKFLTSTGINDQIPAVVAIVGIAGVGKTTLAQLLYNDAEVKRHFKTRAWVYISEDFDVFKVTRTLYESITLKPCDIKDLNILQFQLKIILTGAKFLIVLDDVWNEYYNNWDALQNFLKAGASGSRIIVTSRSQGVASTMRASRTYHLQPLGKDDCWSVFANHAFRSPDAHDASPKLTLIGKEIMKKCGGLPLAAKVLGSLLYSKVDVHEWEIIQNSDIWDLPSDKSDILPSLRLSYYYLSSQLKQCFAFCSIFPKGYVFDKEELILLWMAEGFLMQPRSDKTMEEVGIECFLELLSRSFFQASDDNKSRFIMHDVINDLAQFASGESYFKFKREKSHRVSKRVRHFSFKRDEFFDGPDQFDTLLDSKFLSTFLPLNLSRSTGSCRIDSTVLEGLLKRQKRLRVLSLSYFVNQLEDDRFKNLILLRYLDLSHYPFDRVPESIDCLYNLQTLILSHCTQLVSLPSKMRNLTHLRHLDLTETNSLEKMPDEFCKLESLRKLTKFVVSKDGSSVKELSGLLHLGGKLSILQLQDVGQEGEGEGAADAENAILKNKKNIKELEFSWRSKDEQLMQPVQDPAGETTILEKLHPHVNIEKLSITRYGGTKLPNWLGDSKFLVVLNLIDCRYCSSWPSLGQLSYLQKLHVKKMPEIESIDIEFYGQAANPFASLRILKFELMPKWKNWSTSAVNGVVFPLLQELHLQKCENLIEIPNCLPSLEELFIQDCGELQSVGIKDYPQLQHLSIKGCYHLKKLTLNFSSNLKSLKIHDCGYLRYLIEIPNCLPSLEELFIQDCGELQSVGIKDYPQLQHLSIKGCYHLKKLTLNFSSNLKSLKIHDCGYLRYLKISDNPHQNHNFFQKLEISECPNLEMFSGKGLPACNLTDFSVSSCDNLRSMPKQMQRLLSSLQTLNISDCPSLVSFPQGGLPPSLQTLTIQNCVKLRSMPEQMNTLLSSLQTLNISNCPELVSFPEGGLPPSLQTLTIQNCVNLTDPLNAWGLINTTSLSCLTIECAHANVNSFPDDGLLPASLTFLLISKFPNLEKLNLSGLQHLTLLKSLEIHSCNQLQSLSNGSLPSSLSSLTITGCSSQLTDWCQRDGGIYWDKISHIETQSITTTN